jgi:S1-C subfamily serine protease
VKALLPFRPHGIGRTLAKVDRVRAPGAVESPQQAVAASSGPTRGAGSWLSRVRGPHLRWLAVALVLLLAAGTTYALTRGPEIPPLSRADVDKAVEQGIEDAREQDRQALPDAAAAYQVAQPSIVLITTREGSGRGSGAGVVVNGRGAILTALHVVEGADSIEVQFADGTRSPATVENAQAANDTAVLAAQRLPQVVVPAVLGGGAGVGDAVFALGHPLGLVQSLSAGVVSATGRTITVDGGRELEDLIQFDAAVNPGNSGGPLLNRDGQVVGIVTGLANPSEQSFFVGIGFAVPITAAGGVAGAPPQ